MNNFDQPQPNTPEVILTSEQVEAIIDFDTEEKKLIEEETFGIELLTKAFEEELEKIKASEQK